MPSDEELMAEGIKIEAEIKESDKKFWDILLLIVLMLAAGLILSACEYPKIPFNYSPVFA